MLGFIPFGFVLGAQAAAQHMKVWQVPLMTGVNFAGGSEFAAVGLWASPPPLLLIAMATLLINCRHILMKRRTYSLFKRYFPTKIFARTILYVR